MGDGVPTTAVGRRQLLKRAGIGAAIAWSAPVVMSMHASAATVSCVCDHCEDPQCECVPVDHGCICLRRLIFDSTGGSCVGNQCPPGFICLGGQCRELCSDGV